MTTQEIIEAIKALTPILTSTMATSESINAASIKIVELINRLP